MRPGRRRRAPDGARVALVMAHGKMAGAERILLELLTDTAPAGVVVCAPQASALAGEVEAIGHRVWDFSLPKLAEVGSAAGYARCLTGALGRLAALVRDEPVGVLHAFVANTVKAVAPVAAVTGIPALVSVHEMTDAAAIGGLRSRLQRWPATLTMAKITAVSQAVADRLVAAGYPADRVVVVHNGIARRAPRTPAAAARRQLGLPAEGLVIGVVGRLTRWKGQDVALEAFARFAQRHPDLPAHLAVAGGPFEASDVAYEQRLRQQAGRPPLAGRVHLLGHRQDAELVYDALDVVLVPSVEADPFPTVVLEAGLAGRPVVASALGGAGEAVVDGWTGLVTDPTADAFAGALERMVDPAWRARAGAVATVHVQRHFSRHRFAADLHRLWGDLGVPVGAGAQQTSDR